MSARIVIEQEPDGAGPPYERCCFCWKPTKWWHPSKDVAVCPPCSETHSASQIPPKKDWCNQTSGIDASALSKPHP